MKIYNIWVLLLIICLPLSAQTKQSSQSHNYQNQSELHIKSDSVQQEWAEIYNGTGNGEDYAKDIAVDDSGNVYVTGYSTGSGTGFDYLTIKYNKFGSVMWTARYNGSANGEDEAVGIAIDDSGYVFVTGYSTNLNTNADYTTIKYDRSGNEEWIATYNSSGDVNDRAYAITIDDSSNVYITGNSSGTQDMATVKYNSSGETKWIRLEPNSIGLAITHDDSGYIYVTGSVGIGDKIITIKYDGSGGTKWITTSSGYYGLGGYGYALAVDNLGNTYVAGGQIEYTTPIVGYDYITLKINSSGNIQWLRSYNSPTDETDIADAVVVDNSGNIFVTGWSRDNDYNYVTIKYNSAGVQKWINSYNGPGNFDDFAYDMTLDDSSNVYVTGKSYSTETSFDFATIKYSSSGTQIWVERYNGPGNSSDGASSIALDDSGNVYVTGDINQPYPNSDYATVKYKQIPILILLAPTNLQSSVDTMTVFLSWQDNSENEEGFVIERKTGDSTSSNSFIAIDTVGENITSYIDTSFNSDTIFSYRVFAYNSYGASDYSNIVTAVVPLPTGIKENAKMPLQFNLGQNFPNPFNPTTTIEYSIARDGLVNLSIYNILGQKVVTLVNEYKKTGNYKNTFDASRFSSGVYYYRLESNNKISVKKMVFLK